MTITEFLLARIAEDERAAKVATAGPWRYDPAKVNSVDGEESVFAGPRGLAAVTVASTGPGDHPQSMADAAFIARHDPARVLAECAAKRAIIGQWEYAISDGNEVDMDHLYDEIATGIQLALRDALKHLAAVYADHPAYQDEWAR